MLVVDGEQAPVGTDQLGGEQVVAGQPVAAGQPALPAAEGEPGDPGGADPPTGDGQAVPLGGTVQLAPDHATIGGGGAGSRVDHHPAQTGQVDDQLAGDRLAGHAVPAAAHRQLQAPVIEVPSSWAGRLPVATRWRVSASRAGAVSMTGWSPSSSTTAAPGSRLDMPGCQ